MNAQYSPRITEVEALNVLLSAIGASPITKTDNPRNVDAINARDALLQAVREIQHEKWWFNSEDDYPLTPDARTGEINVPDNIIAFDFSGRFGQKPQLAIRGGKLYDLFHHTYKFDPEKPLRVNVHLSLSFDELPESAKQYAIARAARKFQETMLGDPNLRTWTREDEAAARGRVMDEELRVRKSWFGIFPKGDPAVGMDFRDVL